MKTTLLILLSFSWITIAKSTVASPERKFEEATDVQQTIREYKALVTIAKMESDFNPKAINHKEDAAGLVQIRQVMLKEVNRIIGKEVYFDSCRFNALKSIEMFLVIQRHYSGSKNLKTMAALWNTGMISPKGDKGKVYLEKFDRTMKRIFK